MRKAWKVHGVGCKIPCSDRVPLCIRQREDPSSSGSFRSLPWAGSALRIWDFYPLSL